MSEPVDATPVDDDVPLLDEGLPLLLLERNLAPIRRVAAYATDHPDRARFVEANTRRWLEPLLEASVPESIRDTLILLAGQLAGVDDLQGTARTDRLQRVRQEVARLDAILGLPLPRQDRPRPVRTRRRARSEPRDPKVPSPTKERRSRRGRGRKSSPEPTDQPVSVERPRIPDVRNPFWSGNPFVELSSLDLDDDLVLALAEAGFISVADLLHIQPKGEEVLRPIHGAGRELPTGRVAVGGRLCGTFSTLHPDGRREVRATLVGAGRLRLRWSDSDTASRVLQGVAVGERVVLVGDHTDGELVDAVGVLDDGKSVRLVQYGIDGVDDDDLQRILFRLLPTLNTLRDPIPSACRPTALMPHGQALLALHARGDVDSARRRLAYEEVLGVSLGAAWPGTAQRRRGLQHAVLHQAVSVVLSYLELEISDAAERAFDDIKRDLRRNRPMRRVLTGPPGGNKALIALLAAASIAESKSQVVWLAGTPQQADALHAFTGPLLRAAGLRSEVLRLGKSLNAQERDMLKRGETHVVFMTPQQLDGALDFRRLGLVISSERYGEAGAGLAQVNDLGPPFPDLLVVSGTHPTSGEFLGPWADHAISWVDGPSAPTAVVKTVSQRDSAYAAARTTIVRGGQVAVLFPQIQGKDALDPTEASRVMNAISAEALSGAKMVLLHGAMPPTDRVQTVLDMSHRRAEAMLATVPLEDLAPIPGVDVVVVEHAQRMEPLRLGRIAGMGVRQVSLVVADETPSEEITRLLVALEGPPAVEELTIGFAFFDPATDADLLVAARRAALEILSVDGSLRNGAHADLLRLVRARWTVWMGEGAECPLPDAGETISGNKRRRRRRRRR